jgi:hypothetical protein
MSITGGSVWQDHMVLYTANELLARHKFLLAKLLVTYFRLQNC